MLFPTSEKILTIIMEWRTILEGVLKKKLSSQIEELEALEVIIEKLRKKNPYHDIIC